MHEALKSLAHRPWPLPDEPWKWRQWWRDLAFLHFRVETDQLQSLISDKVRVQEFDGSAWVGVVPFRMTGVMRRPFPDLPGVSAFTELNVRTYVESKGRPGVWFLSLDTNSIPFMLGGRYVYGLPYFMARMQISREEDWFDFQSVRSMKPDARFAGRYRPAGPVYLAEPGSFDHWATERYCLFSSSRPGRLDSVEIHHAPWPLQRGEAELQENSMLAATGIEPLDDAFVCHFSTGVHAITFSNRIVQ